MPDAILPPPELLGYVRAVSVKESDIQRRLRAESEARPDASMLSSPEQSQFLALLVRLLSARLCVEVGVYTGYTTMRLAQALPESGRVIACDVSEELTAIARRYWSEAGVERKIDLRLAPALATLDGLLADGLAGTVDFVYIDADKGTYPEYYERALALVRPGGVVAADNTLMGGEIVRCEADGPGVTAMRTFNERVRDDHRVEATLLPMRDGLTLAWKRDGSRRSL
jgi:predicted O-methyltransferase YrrM